MRKLFVGISVLLVAIGLTMMIVGLASQPNVGYENLMAWYNILYSQGIVVFLFGCYGLYNAWKSRGPKIE